MLNSRVPLLLFRGLATGYAAVIASQPVWIGIFLQGSFDFLAVHRTVGGIAIALTFVMGISALLVGWPARISWLPFVGSIGLFALLTAQFVLGSMRLAALHVPLGVLLIVASAGLAAWSWLVRPADGGAR